LIFLGFGVTLYGIFLPLKYLTALFAALFPRLEFFGRVTFVLG